MSEQLGIGFFKSGQYDVARDGYTPELSTELHTHFLTNRLLNLAEFGAGSGAFTKIVLQSDLPIQKLFIVDPDIQGLEAHKKNFATYPQLSHLEYLHGSAEQSTLPAHSIDGIFAAHCFHWFHIQNSRQEFMRILKPKAKVWLIGRFIVPENSVMREYIALTRFGKRLYNRKENIEAFSPETMFEFFGSEVKKVPVCTQTYSKTFEQLCLEIQIRIDTSGSSDVIAHTASIMNKIKEFFLRNQENGSIAFKIETFYFCGELV